MECKLTYFPAAGRAFAIRVALNIAKEKGVIASFEDIRYDYPTYGAKKAAGELTLPLGQLPTLAVDGVTYCQSTALLRFAAKLAGMYPENPLAALKIDEILATMDEAMGKIPFGAGIENLKEKREAWLADFKAKYVPFLEANLKGPFFGGEELSMIDLWFYSFSLMVSTGFLDHVPADSLEAHPKLSALIAAVKAHPAVVKYGN